MLASSSLLIADEESDKSEIMAKVEPAEEATVVPAKAETAAELSVGTKLYDAATVDELFKKHGAENKRQAEALAPHMSLGSDQVFELRAVNVEANQLRNMRALADKIDPQPLRRLQRLAELDPAAAADIRVTMRANENFMAGADDAGMDMNAGRTANVDALKAVSALNDAVKRARKAARAKKVTDNQKALPSDDK